VSAEIEYALEPDERLFRAGELLAEVFGDRMTAYDVGGHMTCSEAENVAEAMRLAGQCVAADAFIEAHAENDDDPDDLHYLGDDED